jgi:hypothetical protein
MSSVLNFIRCRGPSIRPKEMRVAPLLVARAVLAGLHAVLSSSSAPAQKAGRLAIGLLKTHFPLEAPKNTGAELAPRLIRPSLTRYE